MPMRQKFQHLFPVIGFLALFFCVSIAHADTVEVGQPAPRLFILDLNGKLFDLASLKGKMAIIHFWATWCPSCKDEMPVLEKFYAKHRADVELIAISTDGERHRDVVAATKDVYDIPIALLEDADMNGFGAPSAIPVTYIIDRNGVVIGKLMPDQTKLDAAVLERFLPTPHRPLAQ